MKKCRIFAGLFLFLTLNLFGQSQFPWPVTPFNTSQWVTGNFAEYRSTSANGHYHSGTDIPKADFSPVYAVKNGTVTSMSSVGSNAFVRVNDIAYVHIMPSAGLSIGDPVVASQTVVGTILSGLGHVHMTNGYVGSEKNSMLPNSGLNPYIDTWVPIIRYVQFYQNNTTNQFPTNVLTGRVDIIVKVDEQNAAPGSPTSVLNNGTYKIGYKILSANGDSVVFDPGNNGVRFQFDTKPSNTYVNTVFFRPQSSTTSHVYQVTNNFTSDNYWDTTNHPIGNYLVMVFTEDTRANTDTMYVPVSIAETDLTAPASPQFKFVRETTGGMEISWFPNLESDLFGYRLYFSFDNITWSLFRDEFVLNAAVSDTIVNQVLNRDIYFRMTAVDNAPVPNESQISDVYGMSNGNFPYKALIVDGFDRTDGGWTQAHHDFVFTYGQSLLPHDISFDAAPNEAITDSLIILGDYGAVFWFTGDEKYANETFDTDEQALLQAYLDAGGFLFLSGANIAADLDPASGGGASAADELFLTNYLKSDLAADSAGSINVSGVGGSIFNGLAFNFGQIPYTVPLPDAISPSGGSSAALNYDNGQTAAIQYEGTFGSGSDPGKLVYLAFPFETIASEQTRLEVMEKTLDFFFDIVAIEPAEPVAGALPEKFDLRPNYPNPFNPATTVEFHLPEAAEISLVIYNTLGQKIRTLAAGTSFAGKYRLKWQGRNEAGVIVPSGVYLARFEAVSTGSNRVFKETMKLLLVK